MIRYFLTRSQVAIDACGGDQYLMIQVAAQRTRELLQGAESTVEAVNDEKPGTIAIKEIEQGLYTIQDYENRSM